MIHNIGNMQDILGTANARDWLHSSKMEINEAKFLKNVSADKKENIDKTFGAFLAQSLNEVNKLQQEADVAMEKLATGKSQNLHEVMLKIEEAEIAFKTMNQIRQKVLDTYREIMKIQI